MNIALLITRLVLASVFGVSGAAKLLDRTGSRQSLREFGVPAVLTSTLAVVLPLGELACTAALIRGAWAWWGALGALALLTTFIVAIAANLARGRTPDCHCFGKLHSEPVGWTTVARNAALAGVAGFVAWQGPGHTGPGLVAWVGRLGRTDSMLVALSVSLISMVAIGLTTLLQVLAQNGRLMLRVEALEAKLGGRAEEAPPPPGLPLTTEAPAFSVSSLDGIPVTLEALKGLGKPLLLVFSEPGCSACEALLPDVARWQREHGDRIHVVPMGRGDVQVNRAKAVRHGLEGVLLQKNREVAEAFKVDTTPSAVLIKDGLIASPLAAGADAIRTLVFGETLPAPVKKVDQVPSLELRDLDDKSLNLGSLRSRRSVLLFWNPGCGFCKAMLKDLKSWERTRSKYAPELLVISTGSAESNREQGFRSRVLLDPIFGAAGVFGANGTPSAVTIDEQGRVASDVGVGAPAVLAMLGAASIENAVST